MERSTPLLVEVHQIQKVHQPTKTTCTKTQKFSLVVVGELKMERSTPLVGEVHQIQKVYQY